MRRFRVLFVPLTLVFALLFFSNFLTGQDYQEYQDPYSRTTRVTGHHFGRAYEEIQENAMSRFYYTTLKQPQKQEWIPAGKSYKVGAGQFTPLYEQCVVAPVTTLDTDIELAFLQGLKLPKLQIAVIHSLYLPRKHGADDPNAAGWNRQEAEKERERVLLIFNWYNVDRKNFGVPFLQQWWRDNAAVFGLTPTGDALPEVSAKG